MRPIRAVGVLAALCLVAAACGGDDDSASSPDDSAVESTSARGEDPGGSAPDGTAGGTGSTPGGSGEQECTSQGGDLAFGVHNEPPGLDPYVSGTSGALAGPERMALFDSIMRYDPDSGEYVPRMAESLEPNDEATEWTLTLRDDLTFGNGNPVTTEAVQFTVNRHRAEDSTSLSRPQAALIESMEIVDEQTMVFTLSGPWGNFASLLAGPVGMLADPEAFRQMGAEAFAADPKGSGAGAFQLQRWAPGEELVLEARDDYWGGEVCVDTVTFSYGLEGTGRYEAFDLGEIDAAYIRDVQSIAMAEEDGVASHESITNGGYVVVINHGARGKAHPGEDLRVRQAIAYALDVDLIDQRGFNGQGMPDTALVPDSSLLYSEGLEGPSYDPERARQLLEEAKADGYDGSLHFLCNQSYEDAAIAITALLEDVEFDVELDAAMSVQDWLQRFIETDYDISCSSVGAKDEKPWATTAQQFSGVASPASMTGYNSPAFAEAMAGLRAAQTNDERTAAMAEVQQVWNEEIPGAVYGHSRDIVIWSDAVTGLEFTLDFIPIFDKASVAS